LSVCGRHPVGHDCPHDVLITDELADCTNVRLQIPIAIELGHLAPDQVVQPLEGLRRLERTGKLERLASAHDLDGDDVFDVLDDLRGESGRRSEGSPHMK